MHAVIILDMQFIVTAQCTCTEGFALFIIVLLVCINVANTLLLCPIMFLQSPLISYWMCTAQIVMLNTTACLC